MELTERIPVERLQAIASMPYTMFKQLGSSAKNETERKDRFAQFQRYSTSMVAAKGEMKRLYKYTDATPNDVGGRLYSGGSIQGVPCPIRGYLLDGNCTDIDMKNAHPTILLYICNKHNILAPCLEKYVRDRDEILSDMGDGAKVAFLKSVNSDSVNRNVSDKFFKQFDKEMKDIQKQVLALPDYKNVAASVPHAKVYNWTGSFINRVLCRYENEILQKVVDVVNEEGIEIMSLMFDGLMVYGNHYSDAALLARLEAATAEYGIKLAYKRHDSSLNVAEISEAQKEEENETDQSCAESILKKFPHFKYCRGEFYAYDDRTGLYSTEPIFIQQLVGKYGGMYTTSMMRRKNVIAMIKTLVIDEQWVAKTERSGLGNMLFADGFYDSETRELHPFNPDVVFFGRIAYNFPRDAVGIDDIEDRFFTRVLGDGQGKYMLGLVSRALMGVRMKRMLFGLGESNAGKSVTVAAFELAFQDYVGTFDAGNLAFDKSTRDAAAKLRWALILQRKRLIWSNEIKSTESIDGNMVKKLASESDALVGRNHCGAEMSFRPHFLAVVMANDMPKITPYDDAVNNLLRVVSYRKRFVDNPNGPGELQMDPSVFDEIQTVEFQQKLAALIIKYYHIPMVETEEVLDAKREWVTESPSCIDAFNGFFEITNDPTDFITSAEVQRWLAEAEIGVTMVKLGKEIKTFCEKNGHTNYINKPKKISGKLVQCYIGIRERRDEAERIGMDEVEGDPES